MAVSLSGGSAVHYMCDEGAGWLPDLDDIRAKITERTRAIVVINPNNPTGALYPDDLLKEILEIARQHDLIVFADEIYDKILYDGATHTSIASLADDVLCITMNGLSKNYRACGYRAGWMIISGDKRGAADYLEGLNMLASMRLCANVPGQLGIQTALGDYQSINELVQPGGRLARLQIKLFGQPLLQTLPTRLLIDKLLLSLPFQNFSLLTFHFSLKYMAKETPLMKQYNQIKSKYPDALLLFRVGDFYETFGEDAVKAAPRALAQGGHVKGLRLKGWP